MILLSLTADPFEVVPYTEEPFSHHYYVQEIGLHSYFLNIIICICIRACGEVDEACRPAQDIAH